MSKAGVCGLAWTTTVLMAKSVNHEFNFWGEGSLGQERNYKLLWVQPFLYFTEISLFFIVSKKCVNFLKKSVVAVICGK